MRIRHFAAVTLAVVTMAGPFPAAADELTSVYARILANPTDTELNLQYALIAEGRKEWRKALSAYERVLVNDPDNVAAKQGISRVRRIIQPPSTQVFAEAGATWMSNPLQVPTGATGDYLGYGQLRVKDERPINGVRWRTIGTLYGEIYAANRNLSYANLSAQTGPLIDLGSTMLALYPAVGAAVSYFDDRFYYWEVNASATIEGYLNGAYQWGRIKTGYRQFDPFFTSTDGWYAEGRGRWSMPNVIRDDDVVSIEPWLLWSSVGGTIQDSNQNFTFSPGRYLDGGALFEYSKKINDGLTLALNLKLAGRHYYVDLAPDGRAREDFLIAPGVTALLTGFFGPQTDLRFNYRFDHNNSNDPAHTFDSHTLTAAIVARR